MHLYRSQRYLDYCFTRSTTDCHMICTLEPGCYTHDSLQHSLASTLSTHSSLTLQPGNFTNMIRIHLNATCTGWKLENFLSNLVRNGRFGV